jgi:hypothetical protein
MEVGNMNKEQLFNLIQKAMTAGKGKFNIGNYRVSIERDEYIDPPSELGLSQLVGDTDNYQAESKDFKGLSIDEIEDHADVVIFQRVLIDNYGYCGSRDDGQLLLFITNQALEGITESADSLLKSELKLWQAYFSGECYCYDIKKVSTCNCCNQEVLEDTDLGCCGIYGFESVIDLILEDIKTLTTG